MKNKILPIMLILVGAMVMVAGCGWLGGTYTHDQDVRITKLNSEGLVTWTKLIDSGNYDYAFDFIETSDGGIVVIGGTSKIVCGNYPPPSPERSRLTRLSGSGEILWERDFSEKLSAIVQTRDGSFSAVSDRGVIMNLDPDGTVKREFYPKIRMGGMDHIDKLVTLENDSYLIAGTTIAKIGPEGNVSWQLPEGTSFHKSFFITEMKNQQGWLVLVWHEILQLDQNGNIVRTTPSGNFDEYSKPVVLQTDQGYSIISKDFICPGRSSYCDENCVVVHLDNEGKKINITNLTDAISLRTGCDGQSIGTSDGGYATMTRIEKQQTC